MVALWLYSATMSIKPHLLVRAINHKSWSKPRRNKTKARSRDYRLREFTSEKLKAQRIDSISSWWWPRRTEDQTRQQIEHTSGGNNWSLSHYTFLKYYIVSGLSTPGGCWCGQCVMLMGKCSCWWCLNWGANHNNNIFNFHSINNMF